MGHLLPRAAALLLVSLGCAGCSGTGFGDALSGSFSGAGGEPADTAETPSPTAASPTEPAAASPAEPAETPAEETPEPAEPPPAAAADQADNADPPGTDAPVAEPERAPYRIVISLPSADPTAPSEALSRALKQAGVVFSVETIHRLDRPVEPSEAPPAEAAPRP
ncbi:hypothetical protein EVJ50_00350 [Synechococcus sp. RSCCF101]|uniref:hypothetical protein n=1 Tax=Synechococcus sp. RSCCF101 TaxID=2511069 RepID=UPI001248DE36|nr:hypothetical protein [Synechococcus sp. RSCCF101]QEY30936.1 hypothetical protein EVJ50_00350 [Synechococcus sp. RSCCF101]